MTSAGKSLFYFGIYVLLLGLLFVCVPGTLLSLVGLPPLPLGWARVVGLLALIIGTCDVVAGRHNATVLIRASVYTRLGFAAGIVLLVLFDEMPPAAVLFGAVDGLSAMWTALLLRREPAAK